MIALFEMFFSFLYLGSYMYCLGMAPEFFFAPFELLKIINIKVINGIPSFLQPLWLGMSNVVLCMILMGLSGLPLLLTLMCLESHHYFIVVILTIMFVLLPVSYASGTALQCEDEEDEDNDASK